MSRELKNSERAKAGRMARVLQACEVPMLVIAPLCLVIFANLGIEQSALLSMVVALVCVVVFFAGFETSRPPLKQIMPTVVLSALAVAGRVLFAAIPSFKPVSAIAIIAGVSFGKRSGFLVGALAALISNFLFGQGPWTAWQMYAWGLMGYCAGAFASHGAFKRRWVLYVFSVVFVMIFSWILDAWYVVGYIQPFNWASMITGVIASLPLDITHVTATILFLLVLYEPWRGKLERIKKKYDLAALE